MAMVCTHLFNVIRVNGTAGVSIRRQVWKWMGRVVSTVGLNAIRSDPFGDQSIDLLFSRVSYQYKFMICAVFSSSPSEPIVVPSCGSSFHVYSSFTYTSEHPSLLWK